MKYYLIKTNAFPHEFADGESVILIRDEESKSDIDESDLEFISTLVINSKDDKIALEEFASWWHENTSAKFELELLTEEIIHLNIERRQFVGSLDKGEWSLKDSFIAYPKGDIDSHKHAKGIVYESEFQIQ